MENQDKRNEGQVSEEQIREAGSEEQIQETVSAEALREEYEKRSVLTTQGPLKQQKKKMGTAVKIVIAVVAVALIVGAYFLFGAQEPASDEAPAPTATPDLRIQVIDRDIREFDSLKITLETGESYEIVSNVVFDAQGMIAGLKSGETAYYEVVGDEDFSVNPHIGYEMAKTCSLMMAYRLVAEDVTDFENYGLSEPAVRMEITYTTGDTDVWLYGSAVPTTEDQYYYMTREGTGKVYMGYATNYKLFHATLNSLHSIPSNVAITDPAMVTGLYVQAAGQEALEIIQRPADEKTVGISGMIMTSPFRNDANSEKVDELFTAAIGIQMAAYAGTMEDMADEAGLGVGQGTLVRITDVNGTELEYRVGNVCEDGNYTYVCIDDQSVFMAYTPTVNFVNNCTPQYVIDQFSGLVYIANVEKLTVETPDETYEMSIQRSMTAEGALEESYFFDGESVEEEMFKDLYIRVIGSMVSKVSDDFYLTGDTVLKLTYHLNTGDEPYCVEFITYDDDYYAVKRADGLTVYLIKKDRVQILIDSMAQMRAGEYVIQE